jgi:hypothetical protein
MSPPALSVILRGVIAAEGLRSLWRGLPATLLRDIPFSGAAQPLLLGPFILCCLCGGICCCLLTKPGAWASALYWMGYENLKPALVKSFPSRDNKLSLRAALLAGALSGTCAATLTLPFDVVKTQLQSRLGESLFAGTSPRRKRVSCGVFTSSLQRKARRPSLCLRPPNLCGK